MVYDYDVYEGLWRYTCRVLCKQFMEVVFIGDARENKVSDLGKELINAIPIFDFIYIKPLRQRLKVEIEGYLNELDSADLNAFLLYVADKPCFESLYFKGSTRLNGDKIKFEKEFCECLSKQFLQKNELRKKLTEQLIVDIEEGISALDLPCDKPPLESEYFGVATRMIDVYLFNLVFDPTD